MITIDLKATLIYLVYIALIILIIFLAILTKNLIKTIKKTNKILDDATVVSGIAADKATEIDSMVSDVQGAVSEISNAVKGNQNFIGALSNIVKALGSLISIFRNEDSEEDKKSKK